MIMVTDIVYPGTWFVRLSTDQTPTDETSVSAKLIDPFVWGFTSDTEIPSTEIEDEQITDNSLPFTQMYDYYRTYEQTKEDIQNGYIVNTGVSFSEQTMPTITRGGGTKFYVNHDNIIDANQELNKSLARAAAMRPKI